MFVRVHFDIDGDAQYSRAFEALEHEARDMSDPLERIADDLLRQIGLQFQTEGAYGLGTVWRPLSREYAAWKEEHFPGRPILVRTGEMREHMLDKPRTVRVTAQRMVYEVASDVPVYHQKGRGHNPERKMVALPGAGRRNWDRILHEWVMSIRRGPIRASA